MHLKPETAAANQGLSRLFHSNIGNCRERSRRMLSARPLTQELLVVLSLRDDRLLRCSRMSLPAP